MFRIITMAANALWLGVLFVLVAWEGLPSRAGAIAVFVMFCSVPVVNLAFCYTAQGDSWVGLYLRRKAIEEQKRIDALRNETSSPSAKGEGGR